MPDKPEIGDSLIFKLKTAVKKYNRLYYFLVAVVGFFVGQKTSKEIVNGLPKDAVILNVGSGPRVIAPHVINIDSFPFKGVTIVADATNLPFKDSSVDAVICECVLEHVPDPNAVVREIERVLKRGGLLYLSVPFMDAYHASPDDFHRWTVSGLRETLKNFKEVELKIGWGPTTALTLVVAHWVGLVFSFGSRALYQIITLTLFVLLTPLKFLDFLLRYHPSATNIAMGFYFLGTKK